MNKRHMLQILFRYLLGACISILNISILEILNIPIKDTEMYISIIVAVLLTEIICYYLFRRRNKLVEKMMKCEYRKKYGRNYCADCPDGYECAKNNT